MKTYMLSKMAWNTTLATDSAATDAMMAEFVSGYYGKGAPYIQQYMQLMHSAAVNGNTSMNCFMVTVPCPETPTAHCGLDIPYLAPEVLIASANIFASFRNSTTKVPALHATHMATAELPTLAVVLKNWDQMKQWVSKSGSSWPYPDDKRDAFNKFAIAFNASGGGLLDALNTNLTGF